jgi:hypothetical protein
MLHTTIEKLWNSPEIFLLPDEFQTSHRRAVIGTFCLEFVWELENFRRIPGIVPIAMNPCLSVARFAGLDISVEFQR